MGGCESMTLQPHNDLIRDGKRNRGYAIRVGQKVPVNSANLAYVKAKTLSPEENILLEDVSSQIKENGLHMNESVDYVVYPNSEYKLETEQGKSAFPIDTVYVTDEFTTKKNRQDIQQPVFYKMELSGRFDIRGSQVIPYLGGYINETENDAISFENVAPDKRNDLIYVGSSIRIEANGGPLKKDEVYKVQLIREENLTYRIVVFTNFRNKENTTYKLIYPNYDKTTKISTLKEEVLNAYPFFERVTNAEFDNTVADMKANPNNYKHLKIYTVKETGSSYEFYATSDVMIANYTTRPPQVFRHRVEAKLKTKLSETNKGSLNIGFVFVQNAVKVENLSSIGKTINENNKLPKYMELNNPHTKELGLLKKDVLYWQADLSMPEHHYEDYDMLVITGYGKFDLSVYKNKIMNYLSNGGVVWVDNAGSGINVLDLSLPNGSSFVSDIRFSANSNEFGLKQIQTTSPYTERAYILQDANNLGYAGVSPAIVFGQNEESSQWVTLIKHMNGGPSVITRKIFEKGTLVVSNCGILRGFYHNQEQNINFVLNMLLSHAEEQWVMTPWRNEFVYHRDNLFKQEYKVNNQDVYINDRNDYNKSEIVAKKILYPSIKDYTKAFVKPWFYNATGTYNHVVDGNKSIDVNNDSFESGKSNAQGQPITSWSDTAANAIPGWSTKKLAGQTVEFKHETEFNTNGVRHISVNSTNTTIGTQSYWESENIYLPVDQYKISAWVKTEQVTNITTGGAKIGIYDLSGVKIGTSIELNGSKNWTLIETTFTLTKPQNIKIRLGYVDGNAYGKSHFNAVKLETVGSIKGAPSNAGEKQLYVYSTRPNSSTIDIEAEGFGDANITISTPEISFTYTIIPFIHVWVAYGVSETTGEEYGVYERMYGTPVSYEKAIRKKDGSVNLGYLHTLLPPIPGGKDWYDTNKIYYLISLGSENTIENDLVNIKLFDRNTGVEWYCNNELVVGHKDIFWATISPSLVLHAETGFESIRASKRNFGLQTVDQNKIYCELPKTKDTKENWYLRIHNGQFVKDELSYNEWLSLHQHADAAMIQKYKDRVMKKEKYSTKEYYKQIFNPSVGVMTVENEVDYLTPSSVQVPNRNLFVQQGIVIMEQLIPEGSSGTGTLFRATQKNWVSDPKPRIYIDANNNGNKVEIFEEYPYEVWGERGQVFFPDQTITGKVYATYTHKNFHLYKRTFKNTKVTDDLLRGKRYNVSKKEIYLFGSKENWLIQPLPILKRSKGKPVASNIIPVTEYKIDYEKGMAVFQADPGPVYADYGYFDNEELSVIDFDIENGIFLLGQNVSFKDDLYAKYAFFEDFYEYKGYYDEAMNVYFHLDLNPSVGHYSTLPSVSYVDGQARAEYKQVPSSQLLNKVIYIYIVPDSDGGESVRHCFSLEEWRNIQRSNPMILLLAKVQVRENSTIQDVTIMDARVRGGGVTESLSVKDIDKRVEGRQRYWDIGNWDGKAFYRNGVLIITLPKRILIEYGGTLTDEYVREVIDKHVAYGIYYIIEWE